MQPGRNSAAAGAVALALALHRAPAQHADLLHGRAPLPPGVATLLKLAGGSAPDPESATLARPDELRSAALFFVEQVLLHHDANHYRVLGLEPGASTEQIKEHHRLLMRLYHPDRERHPGNWHDTYATRINLAYTQLHDPQARRRYDASLMPATRPAMARPPVPRASAAHAKPRRRELPHWLQRHLPQWTLAGTALLAAAAVGTVYLNNPPLHAARLPGTSPASTPVAADPDAALARFVSAYGHGDPQAFGALFDDGAEAVSRIRQAYQSLAESTAWRHIAIDGVVWAREGDRARGEGRYRTTLLPRDGAHVQTETGVFRIELLRRGDRALITAIDYQPEGRS